MNRNNIVLALLACFSFVIPVQATVCELPDNGQGTADLPPDCPGGYRGHMAIVDGLPPGTTVEIDAVLRDFTNVVRTPGGSLGGEIQTWNGLLEMSMAGTGALAGFNRFIAIGVYGESHSAPRILGQPAQSFVTDLFVLQGQITGDPDFDLLRVTGGTGYGLPSPGHTTLTRLPGGDWAVDSFFDITYRIDFVGRPGGSLPGLSGSTTGVEHFVAGDGFAAQGIQDDPGCELCFPEAAEASPGAGFALFANTPNPFGPATTIEYYVPASGGPVTLEVFDVTGHVVRTLVRERQDPGLKRVIWNGRDDVGAQAATGVYFYRLRAPGFEKALKMMVIQ